MHERGQGVPKDDAQSVSWYRKAAEQGLAEAQFNLGMSYSKAIGILQNHKEAASWFRKAADQGFAQGQRMLAVAYIQGDGVPRDDAKAALLCRTAAELGDDGCQFLLGTMYEDGFGGIAKDDSQALAWYRKAADQGNKLAQENLSKLERRAEEAASSRFADPQSTDRRSPFAPGQTWVGTYTCAQGLTNLSLQIVNIGPVGGSNRGGQVAEVDAVFAFSGLRLPSGSFRLAGRVSSQNGVAAFTPTAWIQRPPGYQPVGMRGSFSPDWRRFSGKIEHPGCGGFDVRLVRG
jgi:hypothetical protein